MFFSAQTNFLLTEMAEVEVEVANESIVDVILAAHSVLDNVDLGIDELDGSDDDGLSETLEDQIDEDLLRVDADSDDEDNIPLEEFANRIR